MKAILTLIVAACFAMQTQVQAANAPITTDSFAWKSQRGGELKYLLYLPKDYAAKSGERWPLMLFLHGAGERGTDVRRAGIHGPMSLVKKGTNFPFIIVAPQCPENQRWEPEALLQLLDHVTAKLPVDTNRVYVTGLSMGGYGTWSLGLKFPERFAAIAPICGGGNIIDMVLAGPEHETALRALPIWAFHGAKDSVVPLVESEPAADPDDETQPEPTQPQPPQGKPGEDVLLKKAIEVLNSGKPVAQEFAPRVRMLAASV